MQRLAMWLFAIAAIGVGAEPTSALPGSRNLTRGISASSGGAALRGPHHPGLGAVLSTSFGGQIFHFDINRNGTDGIVTEAPSFGSAVETFDLTTGKITKVVSTLHSPSQNDELVTYGIFANDVGLVDEERVSFQNGQEQRNDRYFVLNPVDRGEITSRWTPPDSAGLILYSAAQNQVTDVQAILGYERPTQPSGLMLPWIYVADIASNQATRIRLDSNLFGVGNAPQFAQDTATNRAVVALSPDGGAPHGAAPLNIFIDLATGKQTQFSGLNNGLYGAGTVNGLAVDSTTGVACTTTELNAQVEFYALATGRGVSTQLPNTQDTSQLNSATTVTSDPIHHLFLVAQPISSSTQTGSTIDVYDEGGSLVETINGFDFTSASFQIDGYPGLAVNPNLRIGWVNGPKVNQLQQFFY